MGSPFPGLSSLSRLQDKRKAPFSKFFSRCEFDDLSLSHEPDCIIELWLRIGGTWLCFWDELLHIQGHGASFMFHKQVSGRSRSGWAGSQGCICRAEESQVRMSSAVDHHKPAFPGSSACGEGGHTGAVTARIWLSSSLTHPGRLPVQGFPLLC